MTDTEAALLRAIAAMPDEDTPRLAFADYLDELGGEREAEWAELIRAQVALARGAGTERERLAAREQELGPRVRDWWPHRLGLGASAALAWENWSRGFPLTLSGNGAAIRTVRPALAGRVPLREFNIQPATDADLAEFATWPELRLVRKLGVWTDRGTAITEGGLLALAGCEHLSNLERLRMQWAAYTDAAMDAFLDSPHLAQLVSVKIVGRNFGTLSEEVRQRVRERFGEWDVH
jgi:uncharacterized protein (TIGR02996 family)